MPAGGRLRLAVVVRPAVRLSVARPWPVDYLVRYPFHPFLGLQRIRSQYSFLCIKHMHAVWRGVMHKTRAVTAVALMPKSATV